MAQSVECTTFDFSSGHGFWVLTSSPMSGSLPSGTSTWASLHLPLSLPTTHMHAHSLSLK